MKRYAILTVAAALWAAPAVAQQQGGAQGSNQVLTQEQAQGTGAQYQLSPATVRQIQQRLNSLGYNTGAVDGVWGPATSQAMANFQQAQGIEPTGQPNMNSMQLLGLQGGAQGGMQGQGVQGQGVQGQGVQGQGTQGGVQGGGVQGGAQGQGAGGQIQGGAQGGVQGGSQVQ